MAKRPGTSKDHDFVTNALRVVEKAIGEHLDGSTLDDPKASKNPKSVASGQLWGKLGGAARAKSLSPALRKKIAEKAARTRWKRPLKDD